MSCYFRQMKEVLAEAGIVVTPANRRRVDQAFRQIAGVPREHCPAVWKILKQRLVTEELKRELARELREEMR
jgi:hypothetical protein